MQDRFEGLAGRVYKRWKLDLPRPRSAHPDEEALCCFLEGRLDKRECLEIKEHLVSCQDCAEAFALALKTKDLGLEAIPPELISFAKGIFPLKEDVPFFEIALRVRDKMMELLNTTGDVLVGQELLPAPILRSRSIKDFKDEVVILKDFKDIRVEVKVENKGDSFFNLIIAVKDKETQKVIKDLRLTLMKDEVELESYLSGASSVIFEHVLLGRYRLDISSPKDKLASVLVDINI